MNPQGETRRETKREEEAESVRARFGIARIGEESGDRFPIKQTLP